MAALVSEGMGAVIPSHRFIGFAAAKAGTKTSPQTPPWAVVSQFEIQRP
jgi:hypothetical protein